MWEDSQLTGYLKAFETRLWTHMEVTNSSWDSQNLATLKFSQYKKNQITPISNMQWIKEFPTALAFIFKQAWFCTHMHNSASMLLGCTELTNTAWNTEAQIPHYSGVAWHILLCFVETEWLSYEKQRLNVFLSSFLSM